jgi:outer membrane immunogenic protein
MNRTVFATALLSLIAAPALAADLPVKAPPPLPPPCIWCGFYIGLNGGWAGTTGSSNSAAALSTTETGEAATPIFIGSNTFNQNTSGGFGGGQIGYNWVLPLGAGGYGGPAGWLVGVEADIQGASLHSSSPALFFSEVGTGEPGDSASVSSDSRLNWFATARLRFGYATGPVLFYGTTGVAFGGVRNNLLVGFTDTTDCGFASCSAATLAKTNPRAGWVAGAGIEWMFAPNWSVKGEYQYITLGNFDQTAATAVVTDPGGEIEGAVATRHVNLNFNTVRIGVNYHFGGYGAGGY